MRWKRQKLIPRMQCRRSGTSGSPGQHDSFCSRTASYAYADSGSLPTGGALSENVGYYGFDLTSDRNRLEADVTVNPAAHLPQRGVFFGAFDGNQY